jgi:hypothetical protein
MSEVGVAYVTLSVSTAGIGQGIASSMSGIPGLATNAGDLAGKGFAGKMGGYIKSLAGPLAATFGAVAVANYFKGAIDDASNFAEQGAAVAQIFGEDGSAALQKLAETSATAFGLSKDKLLEAAKTFGVYGQAAGLAGEANSTFSTDMLGLARDLASFNNTSVDDAILALGAGLRGESEPLKRYGVLLDDATLKAKAFEMGIYKGKGVLDQQSKVLAAQQVIMEKTSTQQGDFARTSSGLANQQRILDANLANLGITIGTFLLPAVTAFTVAINGLVSFIADNLPSIAAFVAVLGTWLIATNAVRIATAIWTGVQAVFNAVMALNPIMLIVIAIALLVAAIVWVATKTTWFQDAWTAMTKWITSAWDATVKFFDETFKSIGKWFSNIWKGAQKAWNTFVGWIDTAVKTLGDIFTNVFKFIGDAFKGYINFWIWLFESFINFFVNGINGIVEGLNVVLDGIKLASGGLITLQVGKIPNVTLPRLAQGGIVYPKSGGVPAILAEAGQPEVVAPLSDFNKMLEQGNGKTLVYNAAPNQSLDAETALLQAMRRAKVIAGW